MQVKLIGDSKLLYESECVIPSCDERESVQGVPWPLSDGIGSSPLLPCLQVMVMDIGQMLDRQQMKKADWKMQVWVDVKLKNEYWWN